MGLKCSTCRFWHDIEFNNRGTCHRYPSKVDTTGSYWCGEYAEAPEKIMEAPVVDPVVQQEAPKRRGRPPKEVH